MSDICCFQQSCALTVLLCYSETNGAAGNMAANTVIRRSNMMDNVQLSIAQLMRGAMAADFHLAMMAASVSHSQSVAERRRASSCDISSIRHHSSWTETRVVAHPVADALSSRCAGLLDTAPNARFSSGARRLSMRDFLQTVRTKNMPYMIAKSLVSARTPLAIKSHCAVPNLTSSTGKATVDTKTTIQGTFGLGIKDGSGSAAQTIVRLNDPAPIPKLIFPPAPFSDTCLGKRLSAAIPLKTIQQPCVKISVVIGQAISKVISCTVNSATPATHTEIQAKIDYEKTDDALDKRDIVKDLSYASPHCNLKLPVYSNFDFFMSKIGLTERFPASSALCPPALVSQTFQSHCIPALLPTVSEDRSEAICSTQPCAGLHEMNRLTYPHLSLEDLPAVPSQLGNNWMTRRFDIDEVRRMLEKEIKLKVKIAELEREFQATLQCRKEAICCEFIFLCFVVLLTLLL